MIIFVEPGLFNKINLLLTLEKKKILKETMQDKNCGHKWDLKKKKIHESVILLKILDLFKKKICSQKSFVKIFIYN